MKYKFIAPSMLIFAVSLPSGKIKNIEFEDAGNGVFSYGTSETDVAIAIRLHPLTREGRITDMTFPGKEQVEATKEENVEDQGKEVLRFDNITKARNYLAKTFKVNTRGLKTPDSVKAKAKEFGISIDF